MRSATLCCQLRTKRLTNMCSPPEPMSTKIFEKLFLSFRWPCTYSTSPKITFCVITIKRLSLQTYRKYDSKTKTKNTCSQLFLCIPIRMTAVPFHLWRNLWLQNSNSHTHTFHTDSLHWQLNTFYQRNWSDKVETIELQYNNKHHNRTKKCSAKNFKRESNTLNVKHVHVWIQSICKTIVYNLNGENRMHVRLMRTRFVILKHKKKTNKKISTASKTSHY